MTLALRASVVVGLGIFGVASCASHPKREYGIDIPGEPRKAGWGLLGDVVNQGLIDCFEESARKPGEPAELAHCEASAIAYTGADVVIASDKPIPGEGRSSVFTLGMTAAEGKLGLEGWPRSYLTAAPLLAIEKPEDLAVSPEGDFVFLTSAFDRHDEAKPEWDLYNVLVAWPPGAPERVAVVNPSERDGVHSSVSLREPLRRALKTDTFPDGPPYLKIEGLAALPGRRLLFGVREQGSSYQSFDYSIDLVEARYSVEDGVPRIDPASFQLVYSAEPTLVLGHRVGVSSLEWDPDRDRIYILTSFEHEPTDTAVGGFLFALSAQDLASGLPPRLLRHRGSEQPLMFGHKAEGIAILNELHVVVIHDDDRVTHQVDVADPSLSFHRAPHQAAYTVIRLDPRVPKFGRTKPDEATPPQ